MKYGEFSELEDQRIERTANKLESMFEESGSLEVTLKATGTNVKLNRIGKGIYEVRVRGAIYRVCNGLISLAITICGYTERALPKYKGWRI